MLGKISHKLRYLKKFLIHPSAPEEVKKDLYDKATDPSQEPHRWVDGAPLSEVSNAHYTNTPEEMAEGLSGNYNFLEGDIWLEGVARRIPGIDAFREPIMAHDYHDVDGLTLGEWLEAGKASGKGLKLDIKQSASIPKVVEAVKEAGIPDQRLIFNADMVHGPGWNNDTKFKAANILMDVQTQVDEMQQFREAFPDATLAVGLYTSSKAENRFYTSDMIEQASDIADELGGRITFPLRAEYVTPETVESLKEHGSVSIWNDPKSFLPKDLDAARQEFRDMGVDGMIDLRKD